MIEDLQDLKKFIQTELREKNVNLVNNGEGSGFQVFIDHGGISKDEGMVIIDRMAATIRVEDSIDQWEKVLRAVTILQKKLREEKSHKWLTRDIERTENNARYILTLNIEILYPIG